MLHEARMECQSLRTLNERLLGANDELKQSLAISESEKNRALLEYRQQYDAKYEQLAKQMTAQRDESAAHIAQLQRDLEAARTSSVQMQQIRKTLQREKDIEVLNLRREIVEQKERELREIRSEVAEKREEIVRLSRTEVDNIRRLWKDETVALNARVNQLEQTREQLERKVETLETDLATAHQEKDLIRQQMKPPGKTDFGQQYDDMSEEILEWKSKQAEFDYVKEQLWILFGDEGNKGSHANDSGGGGSGSESQAQRAQRVFRRSAGTWSRILEMCRGYVEKTEQKLVRYRLDHEAQVEEIRMMAQKHAERVQSDREQMEMLHRRAIDTLVRTHRAEVTQIKVSYEAKVKLIQDEAEEARE
eukprot:jgi/Hompol1/6775/HPOL_000931-RA